MGIGAIETMAQLVENKGRYLFSMIWQDVWIRREICHTKSKLRTDFCHRYKKDFQYCCINNP